jgi:hypothetical protein
VLYTSLALGAGSAKFNNFNIEDDSTELNVLTGMFYLEFPIWNAIYIRPHVELAALLSADVKEELGVNFVPSIGLALGFAP